MSFIKKISLNSHSSEITWKIASRRISLNCVPHYVASYFIRDVITLLLIEWSVKFTFNDVNVAWKFALGFWVLLTNLGNSLLMKMSGKISLAFLFPLNFYFLTSHNLTLPRLLFPNLSLRNKQQKKVSRSLKPQTLTFFDQLFTFWLFFFAQKHSFQRKIRAEKFFRTLNESNYLKIT